MPPRRRPNRFPRRVRHLLKVALTRARRHLAHQPRPTLESVVAAAAHLEAQLELLPSARRALELMRTSLSILEEPIYQPPLREAPLESGPEVISEASNPARSESPPLPTFLPEIPLKLQECTICFERKNDVILNCGGGHAFCGQCPAQIYRRDAKCPMCRRNFDLLTPLYNVPILNILPLADRCTVLPDFELFEMTAPELELPADFEPDWALPGPEEDWDLEETIPHEIHQRPVNLLDAYSQPENGMVRCGGCHVWLLNNPTHLIRHSTRCQALRATYNVQ